jgi:cobalt/nickel transport system permease protein
MFLSALSIGVIIALQMNPLIVLSLLFLILLGGAIAGTRWRVVLTLIAKFEILILFWMFLMPFIYGDTILLSLGVPWGYLNIYQEGLEFGILIGLRMMTTIILFIVTLSHMSLTEFIGALRTLRVPVTILGSLLIMLRYIPLFMSERKRMQEAQSLRGFEMGKRFERIKSLGYLVGSTIDRAFDRSVRVYNAMTLRGFGRGMLVKGAGFRQGDLILLVLLLSLTYFVFFMITDILAVISI